MKNDEIIDVDLEDTEPSRAPLVPFPQQQHEPYHEESVSFETARPLPGPKGLFARELPHSSEAEEYLLSCCFIDGMATLRQCINAGISPRTFFAPANQIIYAKLLDLATRNLPIEVAVVAEELKNTGEIASIGGFAYLTQVSSRIPTTAQTPYFIDRVRDLAARREMISRAGRLIEAAHGSGELADAADALATVIDEHARVGVGDTLLNRALASEVDPNRPPAPDRPILWVGGRLSSTSGNLTALSGRAKTAKSSLIGAAAAACLVADGLGGSEADTLGVKSSPPNGRGVVLVDTEQSPAHAAENLRRTLARAGVAPKDKPNWMRLFPLAGWTAHDLATVLPLLLDAVSRECGGLHAVFIDGGADFASDVNSSEEAAELCAGWHALAIKHACAIVVIVHSNEARQADDIARGWLGKQLRRKAESNLTLKRDGESIVLYGEDGQRHAPIPESEGPRFRWDADAGMHRSCESLGTAKAAAQASEPRELADEVIGSGRMRFADVIEGIKKARCLAPKTAEKRFSAMKKAGVIVKDGVGFWSAPSLKNEVAT